MLPALICCPHARGGGPPEGAKGQFSQSLSPRTWGWTGNTLLGQDRQGVVPTHVGVDRRLPSTTPTSSRCPHARGGGPMLMHEKTVACRCPHARGGGPKERSLSLSDVALSPRAWGAADDWAAGIELGASPLLPRRDRQAAQTGRETACGARLSVHTPQPNEPIRSAARTPVVALSRRIVPRRRKRVNCPQRLPTPHLRLGSGIARTAAESLYQCFRSECPSELRHEAIESSHPRHEGRPCSAVHRRRSWFHMFAAQSVRATGPRSTTPAKETSYEGGLDRMR